MMKITKEAKLFLSGKGDKEVRKLINKGGREGAEKDFNKILKRAAMPAPLQPQESEPK